MINRIIRLTSVKNFDTFYKNIDLDKNRLIIRPDYLSICAADLRYYTGKRKSNVMKEKLPLALIHEMIGTVVYDCDERIGVGNKVVVIPNTDISDDDPVKGNYQEKSKFRSSDIDGFMQDFIVSEYDRVIKIDDTDDLIVYVLSELLSVAVNAVESSILHKKREYKNIGIWGDGSLGFAMAIVLKTYFPESNLILFGHNYRKMMRFMMVDKIVNVNDNCTEMKIDCAFECVGGVNSADAINQIINLISPQGSISLLGVSEDLVSLNTRVILEKGLVLLGNSRSEKSDFEYAVRLIAKDKTIRTELKTIISEEINVKNIYHMYEAFDNALVNDFKTIMKWSV